MISVDTRKLFTGESDIPISHVEGRLSLRQCYDASYGLDTGPFGIEMTDEESPAKFSLYEYWAEIHARERIFHHYGLDLDQFLNRPRYKIEILVDKVKPLNKSEETTAAKIQDEIKRQLEQNSKNNKT